MSPEQTPGPEQPERDFTKASIDELTDKQLGDLKDPVTQEKYRKEMLRQLRLRQCPGCGEDELF